MENSGTKKRLKQFTVKQLIINNNLFKIRNKLAEYMDHRYYGLAVSFHIGQGLKVRLLEGNV